MRFRNRQQDSQVPEVNLIPMLDVLMTVLTFFIIVSMTLVSQQGVDIQLPNSAESAAPPSAAPEPLVVKLTQQGQILLNEQPVSRAQLEPQMQAYLNSSSQGFVVLAADRKIPYSQVVELLGEMREVGGDRVSLAIE